MPASRQPSSQGSTLIEVVVALAILAGALVSLPGVLLHAGRTVAAARRSVVASIAAADKLEQLRGLAWGFDAAGVRVEDRQSDASRSPVTATGGSGLALSPQDSLAQDVPGFVDYLDADGRWLGGAGPGSGGAAYVRRWSVTTAPGMPADVLVLRVRVLARGEGSAEGNQGLLEVARLATLKSRRAR